MSDASEKPQAEFSGDFEKDVAAHLQDDVLQRIVEVAWGYGDDAEISIDDVDQLNALNIEITGTIEIDGQEHSFHIKDGNNNGTEILSCNEDAAIHREPRDPLTLIPDGNAVTAAVRYERAEDFLETWEKDKAGTGEHGEALAKLPSAQAYDSFFAPGTGAARYHQDKAAQYEYQIGYESDAFQVRKTLIGGVFKVMPLICENGSELSDANPAEVLADWADLKDTETDTGRAIKSAMAAMVARMAGDLVLHPTEEEAGAFRDLGATLARRPAEVALRGLLWSRMISFEPIEGFDPKDLPENPIAELFKVFDSELVGSTKVNPVMEITDLTEQFVTKISRGNTDVVDDAWYDAAARVGYRLVVKSFEPEPLLEDCIEP